MKTFYQMPYRADAPYPVLTDLTPNRRDARLMLTAFSGPDSELTTIMQYIYYFQMASESHRPMAFALKQIAQVDMQHLVLVGNCIRLLGEEPKYWSFRGQMRQFWNASFTKYGKTMRNRLECGLLSEYELVDCYLNLCRRIDEPQVVALLERIIEDEHIHIALLERMLTMLD